MRVNREEQMSWKKYTFSVLIFPILAWHFCFYSRFCKEYCLVTPSVKWDLSFNTASSFVTIQTGRPIPLNLSCVILARRWG